MTFCTGGIRCVKANAFLEQELGFTSTFRLQDGIHGYRRWETESLAPDESRWRGSNFVFYERAERMSDASADGGSPDADGTTTPSDD